MTAIDFPNSPTIGDTYLVGSREWEWTGSAWVITSASVGPVGPEGPQGPPGDLSNLSVTSPITYSSNTIGIDYSALVIDGGSA